MPTLHPRAKEQIDRYISSVSEFARPICRRLRAIIRSADPEIVEDWKWGPNFNKEGMVCGFGAFKAHVTLTFFRGSLLKDPKKALAGCTPSNAHNRSIKFTRPEEIDEDVIAAFVKEAAALNRKGVKAPSRREELSPPQDLKRALAQSQKARGYFDALTPGYRREFVEWIAAAKRPETRAARIEKTVRQCARGKTLNDKYR